jgi:Cu-Zn family superoxide dismutase
MQAVAVLTTGVKGVVRFIEQEKGVMVQVDMSGLRKNGRHGFHIHEAGDLTDACTSACAHFNPHGMNHGGPHSKERHMGDLGNIQADGRGKATYQFFDPLLRLRGKYSIIGRSVVVHAGEDDLGVGDAESLKTGNSGKRLGCAVIGYAKENFA